jgi:hypothetical protein
MCTSPQPTEQGSLLVEVRILLRRRGKLRLRWPWARERFWLIDQRLFAADQDVTVDYPLLLVAGSDSLAGWSFRGRSS